ncbi:MAG: hypothetical protein LQ343_000177 [Gyalolechia ehrenbergii]|nr:MAG: hypothetical protein LQ343_000177 [Gyalolechia ehrenbergii]
MSFEGLPRSYDSYPKTGGRYTVHYPDPIEDRLQPLRSGSRYDSERARNEDEISRSDAVRLEKQVRMEEYERYGGRDRQRSLAQSERARHQERIPAEQNARKIAKEQDRCEREQQERMMAEQDERIRREIARREQELDEKERMDHDSERRKVLRRERRTNSGKTTSSESRSSRVERTLSYGPSTPMPEEPKSFFSRVSGFWPSTPAGKSEVVPSKIEVAPKIEAAPKIESVPKTEKSESQPRSKQGALVDLEGYFLQPAQDSLIQKSVVALSDSIDQHVYNHYGDRATSPPYDVFLKVVQIDAESARLPQSLVNQGMFRLAAVRRMIASALIRNISVKGDPSTTFLPKEIVSLLTVAPAHGTERREFPQN